MPRRTRREGTETRGERKAALWPWAPLVAAALLLAACGGPRADPAPAEKGRALYTAICQACHGDAATGAGGVPPAPSHGVDGHTWHHADGQIVEIVLGKFNYPGRVMPSFAGQLSEEEVRAVLAYLKTNWLPEQRAFQEEVSRNWEVLKEGTP
ncbi:MAG: cytochrome c [Chloroflexi bacterium]|nr:cytochrome c [Chloroflexota bacterium]